MKNVLVFSVLLFSTYAHAQTKPKPVAPKPASASASGGHNINITVTPLKNQWLYLYSYFGKNYQVADSTFLNAQSQGAFKGKNKLGGGIYIAVSDKRTRLFDFLVGDEQNFFVVADTLNLNNVAIKGSKDNELYIAYSAFLAEKAPKLNALQQQLQSAKTSADSAKIRTELTNGNKELLAYRDDIIKKYPTSMLSLFFQTVKRPEVPAMPKLANGNLDSSYPARYMKEHFWDDVDFSDDRLLRTPFFDPKLEDYYKYYVHPDPDSIIQEVNYMLLSARGGKEMFKYLLGRFTDKYINPEVMGQDKVFVFLFNNYFSKGDTTWLNATQKKFIFDRAYSLMTNLIGEQAPVMDLVDSLGKPKSLYGLQGPFTFVIFWDPNCGHCKETVPRIDSIYNKTWKNLGVKIYAVNVDENTLPEWRKYINEHKLGDWTHVYQTKQQREAEQRAQKANFRQLYDVYQTPTMYLLDKEKRIVAKKLSIEQFNDVIQAKLKNDASKK
jgi:thiol-disulfide isomerase/thioredoxin